MSLRVVLSMTVAAVLTASLMACADRSSDHSDGRPPEPRATPVAGPVPTTPSPIAVSGVCARFEALGRDGIVAALGDFVVDADQPLDAAAPPATAIDPYVEATHCELEFGEHLGQVRRSLVTVTEQRYPDERSAWLGPLRNSRESSLVLVEDLELGDDAFRYTFLLNVPPTAIKAVYGVWIQEGATRYRISIRENHREALTSSPPEEAERHEALMDLVELLGPWDG